MDQHDDECHNGAENPEKHNDEESIGPIDELKKTAEVKKALRQRNLNPDRPDAGFFRTLDSSIKRNIAAIKKLKVINEEQRECLIDELRSINLSKYVTEAVAAICDSKLRSSDIQAAVYVCSSLHQRYEDFSSSIVQGLMKVFFSEKSADDTESDRNAKALKKRSTLKLLLELFFSGVINDPGIFVSIIKDLTNVDNFKDKDTTQMNLSLLTSFAREGRILLGLPPSEQELNGEIYKDLILTTEQKKAFKKWFHTYYDASVEVLRCEHSALQQMECENAKTLNSKGELSDDAISSYEKLRKSYDHLHRGISSLADALEVQPPVMPEDNHMTRMTSGDESSSSVAFKEHPSTESLWDDEDTRAFYECLPDLRSFVPAALLGETEPKSTEASAKTQEQSSDSADSEKTAGNAEEDCGAEKDADPEKSQHRDSDKKEKHKGHDGGHLDSLLQRLPCCVSRDLIDQLTVEFCYTNSKSSRKRLVRALFNVPRTSLELLPYYSRMVATLSTCMKDVSSTLVQMLEEEFNFLINKKDQMNIETKMRNIRFIGELCKFRVVPASLVFSFLKSCLDDFMHHNIDVACNLVETSGQFLYRCPETSLRMSNMLETLMRLKNVKNLDPRHIVLVENAYYLCKPPDRSTRLSKARPPLHQYIRKLLFSDLDKTSIEHVLRQLRKLPWDECEKYLQKCFVKVHKGKYGQIHLIASLTAGLGRYHEGFAISVVDEVLEEIRVGMELNEHGMQQRRLAHMRLLGELYNYEQLESSVVFDTLYLVLAFGHGTPEEETLDPARDCFRIRMVITLVETCGHYFDKGSSKRKLDRFLVYFQRYILGKGVLPIDVEFDLQDMFGELRPSMARFSSVEDAEAALLEMDEQQQSSSDGDVRRRSNADEDESGGVEMNGSETGDESGGAVAGEEEEEEEEVVRVRHSKVDDDPQELADFDRDLKALVQESLDLRKLEARGRPVVNMVVPMNVSEERNNSDGGRGGGGVSVSVLLRRGSKQQQARHMYVPHDCVLVQSAKEKEAAELVEKQDIKRIVLQYNDREEEDMYTSALVSTARSTWAAASPPTQRHRYLNHPSSSPAAAPATAGHYYRRK